MSINWQQFGLKANPYDAYPLVEGGTLSIEEAFIGREQERNALKNLFESENSVCLTICGDTGVGKTSLANMHKFIWKYREKKKPLFSFRTEIEASDTLLEKHNFIMEVISSVVREISLLEAQLMNRELLQKLQKLVDISQTVNISGGLSASYAGIGASFNLGTNPDINMPQQITTNTLEWYFIELVKFIKSHKIAGRLYDGLIIHINNFDVVLQGKGNDSKVISFFNNLRDFFQIKDTYYLFLGPKDFYSRIIAQEQRVKSIFVRTPLLVKPLTKKEVVQALTKRMDLLKSDLVDNFIKPINDDVIFKLYDLYGGDIRSIMTGVKDIINQCNDRLVQPLSLNQALVLLGRERWNHISNQLTNEQIEVLKFLVHENKYVTNKEIAGRLKKAESNISGYFLPPLKELGVIEEKERNGKKVLLGLTIEYEPLKWWLESEQQLNQSLVNEVNQLQPGLFG